MNVDSKASNKTKETKFGLKISKCLPLVEELMVFEDDHIKLVKEIKFCKVKNQFQNKLGEDIKKVYLSNKTITPADETPDSYRLDKEEYKYLLVNTITSTYKKLRRDTGKRINRGGIMCAKDANIFDIIELNGTGNCFITSKYHKTNLQILQRTK